VESPTSPTFADRSTPPDRAASPSRPGPGGNTNHHRDLVFMSLPHLRNGRSARLREAGLGAGGVALRAIPPGLPRLHRAKPGEIFVR